MIDFSFFLTILNTYTGMTPQALIAVVCKPIPWGALRANGETGHQASLFVLTSKYSENPSLELGSLLQKEVSWMSSFVCLLVVKLSWAYSHGRLFCV